MSAMEQRAAVDAAWQRLVNRVADHPAVGRFVFVASVLILVRLLIPAAAEQVAVAWLQRLLTVP